MSATEALTGALAKLVLRVETDIRERLEDADTLTLKRWRLEHGEATTRGRTALPWIDWSQDRITQAAVAWVLSTVFVRFVEDNHLVSPVWISGPGAARQEALDARDAFFRQHPLDTDREWLRSAFEYLGGLPAMAGLVDPSSALHLAAPSGQMATEILEFWWQRDESGALVHDLTDAELSTRFLGDLYQDLSRYARERYALLQTPVFVEEFILDRALEPALAERPLESFRMIDPACGSGHFLLGAFRRLLERWHRQAPGLELQARVQAALGAIHGVDLNPFAVAIAHFRLTLAALQACGLRSLEDAPGFHIHLATGDSLLHGGQMTLMGDVDLAALSGHSYSTEDLGALRSILEPGAYDCVVANPPYITVKDRALNEAYRRRYSDVCSGKYALTVPFMQRLFQLARPGGWVGQITSNSFMKREFGAKLIENFLSKQDLRLVADTSGAYIPGHGTPTVILVGRNEAPVTNTVRAALGVRGEPGRPQDPAQGMVWRSLVEHIDEPGWDDGWITITDLPRSAFDKHPWSLSGGGARQALNVVDTQAAARLKECSESAGITSFTLEDDVFLADTHQFRTRGVAADLLREMVLGDGVRDWASSHQPDAIFPYDSAFRAIAVESSMPLLRWMWPYRTNLSNNVMFGGQTKVGSGLRWSEYGRLTAAKLRTPLSITFAFVATHNHFVLDRGGTVFNRSAPVIKLPAEASEDDHLGLLGVLNSSTACFWLKQNSYNKGGPGGAKIDEEEWNNFYEFTGSTLQDYPLPVELPVEFAGSLDGLAQKLSAQSPEAVSARAIPTRAALDGAHGEYGRIRAVMIYQQEELDWEVYRLYGLIDEDLTYSGDDLRGLALGERAFEIELARTNGAAQQDSAWFTRHGSSPITEIPGHWPAAYRELVQRRLDVIASDRSIRLLERPEYKRRWVMETREKREERALEAWILDRLEDPRFWFDAQDRPAPHSLSQLADMVARDAELVSVINLWQGRPDSPLARSLAELMDDQAVPYLAAYRYKPSGLMKREAWEETWRLQRREDEGQRVGTVPAPPRYTSADFRKNSFWQHRGKLDVPKERFIVYPATGRDADPTSLLGWAGWNHAEQSLALLGLIQARVEEGWSEDRLRPLVAGVAELQPWVDQWHSDIDQRFGTSLAAFCREQLATHAANVGRTVDELRRFRPQEERKPKQEEVVAT